jgi:hypothetical protein
VFLLLFFFFLLKGWVKTDMGLVKGQKAQLDISYSCGLMLEVMERACVLQMQHQSIIAGTEGKETKEGERKEFIFSASIQEIEKRGDHLQEFVQRLQTDDFVYCQWEGKIMPW